MKDPTPKPKRSLLVKSRQWHRWGGLFAGVFILVAATSGIVLNYKQPIFTTLGVPTKRDREVSPLPPGAKPAGVAFTTAGIAGGTVTFEQALALVKNAWGEAGLERAEIRAERGGVTYRFRNAAGEELWVDAADGRHAVKGGYERISRSESDGKPVRSTDWGKILIDLHTGRIGGEAGKIVMSLAALTLLFLTASGVYMWARPLLGRSQNSHAGVGASAASAPRPERELVKA